MIIETERLILRKFCIDDAFDLYEYLENPSVNCFTSLKIKSLDEAKKQVIERSCEELYFAICLKSTRKVIGEIFTHSDEMKDTYSPCWMLNSKYQGYGYAYEAVYAFFEYLFIKLNARRIYTYTEDDNLSSQHLCEKLGMRKEGLFIEFVSFINNQDGTPKYENTLQYAILKREWLELTENLRYSK